MSRSYKHVAGSKDHCKGMKELANRKVRHYQDLSNGMMYKKVFNSYDICDYKFLIFRKDDLISWKLKLEAQKVKECYKDLLHKDWKVRKK